MNELVAQILAGKSVRIEVEVPHDRDAFLSGLALGIALGGQGKKVIFTIPEEFKSLAEIFPSIGNLITTQQEHFQISLTHAFTAVTDLKLVERDSGLYLDFNALPGSNSDLELHARRSDPEDDNTVSITLGGTKRQTNQQRILIRRAGQKGENILVYNKASYAECIEALLGELQITISSDEATLLTGAYLWRFSNQLVSEDKLHFYEKLIQRGSTRSTANELSIKIQPETYVFLNKIRSSFKLSKEGFASAVVESEKIPNDLPNTVVDFAYISGVKRGFVIIKCDNKSYCFVSSSQNLGKDFVQLYTPQRRGLESYFESIRTAEQISEDLLNAFSTKKKDMPTRSNIMEDAINSLSTTSHSTNFDPLSPASSVPQPLKIDQLLGK